MIRSTLNKALQIGGILASYATPILISRLGGAEDQGHYASLKSLFDLSNALFLFGLPQSLVLMINRQHTNIKSIAPYVQAYSLFVFLVFLTLALAAKFLIPDQPPIVGTLTAYLAVALGVSGFVTFGLVRAIFLTRNDGTLFSLFTTLPQLLLLVGAALVVSSGSNQFAYSFALLGIIVLPMAIGLLLHMARSTVSGLATPKKLPPLDLLLSENAHTFVQAVFYNLQPWLTFLLLASFGSTKQDIGLASIIILPVQALHAMIGVFSPVIFNRLSKAGADRNLRLWTMDFLKWPLILQAAGLALMPFAEPLVTAVFGSSFAPAALPLQITALSTFPVALTRMLSPYLQTSNLGSYNTISCASRLFFFLILFLTVQLNKSDLLLDMAIAWSIAEWFTCGFLSILITQANLRKPRT